MSVNNFASGTVLSELEHDGANVLCSIVRTCIGEEKIGMWEEWMIENETSFVGKGKDAHAEYELEWTRLHEEFEGLVNCQLEEAVRELGVDMAVFEGLLKRGVEVDEDEGDRDSLYKQVSVFISFINAATEFLGFVDIMSDREKRAYYFGILGGWRKTLK